jgi:single-strand DNA-binding protein
MSINQMVFTGNCGADMEIRHTPKGVAIGTVNVAVTSGWGDNKKTTWVKCTMFKERAEKLAPYLTKGTPVTMSGEFQMDEWTDKEGNARLTPVCMVRDVHFGKKQEGAAPQQQAQKPQQNSNFLEDDIPF